jgi:hypothetical protein
MILIMPVLLVLPTQNRRNKASIKVDQRKRRYAGGLLHHRSVFVRRDICFPTKRKKRQIYNVYTKCALLDRGYIKSTVNFLDQVSYSTINDKNPSSASLVILAMRAEPAMVIKWIEEIITPDRTSL